MLDEERVILPAIVAVGRRCVEGKRLAAVAFDYGLLGAPSIDLAYLHGSNLVVRSEALYNLDHGIFLSLPQTVGIARLRLRI